MTRDPGRHLFRWIFWVLVGGAVITLFPLWLPLLLAAWFAHVAQPLVAWLERRFGKRRALAVWVTLALFLVILVPVTAAVVQLIVTGSDLARNAMQNQEWNGALRSLVSDGDSGLSVSDLIRPGRILDMIREHGAVALGVAKTVFGVTATAVVQIFVFFLACHRFLSEGGKMWSWAVEHAPFDGDHMERLRSAFNETGRGLVIGLGLTCLSQAIVATVAYTALGIPRAFLLGGLTFFAAFIPTFGTAMIWVPVAAGLALSGRTVAALILAGIGVVVVGTIDNLLNPLFSRWGRLDLPVFILIISIFGGFTMFGAWGFLVGPLLMRLAKEVLVIAREER